MNRAIKVIVVTGAILVGTQAIAQDTLSQPTLSKRQMVLQVIGCMRKEMAADRSISYNAAARECKAQVTRSNDHSAPDTLVAASTPVAAATPVAVAAAAPVKP
jgi:hypothetical protein